MILTIELTELDYVAIQFALTKAANARTLTDVGRLELLHLQTLLAEASVKEDIVHYHCSAITDCGCWIPEEDNDDSL